MGQGSSQLDADAPNALDDFESSGVNAMSGQEDDMAASSQLASEELTSKHRPKNKDRKKKSSKRKSEGSVKNQEASPLTNGHGKSVEAHSKAAAPAESPAVKVPKDTMAQEAAATDAKENVKRSKKKSAKAAEVESVADVAHEKPSKKRKRKSKEAADLDATAQPDTETAAADLAHTPNRPENEEKPAKKLKNCKRLSKSGAFPTPLKETPIPLPVALPRSPEDHKDQTPSKSKKKARGAERGERPDKENVRSASPGTNDAKVEDTRELDEVPSKKQMKDKKDKKEKREKREKKEKNSRRSDTLPTQESSGSQDNLSTVPQIAMPQTASSRLSAADDSMIDPALLPQTGTQNGQQVNGLGEEQLSQKKSKKSKSSRRSEKAETRNEVEAVRKPAEKVHREKSKNGLFDTSDAHERTGQTAYIEHQKKKEKRKRESEQVNGSTANDLQVSPSTAPESTQESRPKKRKTKASETEAQQDTNSKGEKKGTFGDSDDFPSSGPYTKWEIATLTRAIDTYRDFYELTQRQVNDIVQAGVFAEVHNKSCKAFWDEICPCLPNRWSRETIIKFVRRKWHNYEKRGKWDLEEDDMLREAYARFPGQWTNIGGELGRFPDDCRDRWRNYLSCSDTMSTKRWHDSEVNELLNIVQECLNSLLERLPEDQQQRWREELQCTEPRKIWMPKEIQNLVRKMPICMDALRAAFAQKHPRSTGQKRATDRRRGSGETDSSVVINWDLVSEKMGKKRSRLQIMSKWKALENMYTGELRDSFFTEANHWRIENGQKWAENMLPGDKYNIVLAMQDLGLTNEERIVWNTVAYHDLVRLRWAHQAKMTWLLMKSLVPPKDSLPKTLEALKRYYEKNHAGELDKHWHKPRKGSKSATQSREASEAATNGNGGTGELEWRGGVKFPKETKSAAWVSSEDEEDDNGEQ